MLIRVKVFPNSKREEIIRNSKGGLEVSIKEKPIGGEATRAVLKAVASFLGVPLQKIRVIKGIKQRNKILEILEK